MMTAIDREILELKMKSYSDKGLTYEELQRYCYLQDKKRRESGVMLDSLFCALFLGADG